MWRSFTRTAIEAMREPTEAMERAGYIHSGSDADASTVWQVMIDAALATPPSSAEPSAR